MFLGIWDPRIPVFLWVCSISLGRANFITACTFIAGSKPECVVVTNANCYTFTWSFSLKSNFSVRLLLVYIFSIPQLCNYQCYYRVSHKTSPTLFSLISRLSDQLELKVRTFSKSPFNSLIYNVQYYFQQMKDHSCNW